MRKKYLIAVGLAAVVGVVTSVYKIKQDDSNPTSPLEQMFPGYEEMTPTPTPIQKDAPIRITYNSSGNFSYKN